MITYDELLADVKQRRSERWAEILAGEPAGRAVGRRPRDPDQEALLLELDRARLAREQVVGSVAKTVGDAVMATASAGAVDHGLAEARSLALHGAIAERLRESPELVAAAQQRVAGWRRDGSVAAAYVEAWETLLASGLEPLIAVLVDPGERASVLRQVTPFAGVIGPRQRWQIWREVRAAR